MKSIDDLRSDVDAVTLEMVRLLGKRLDLVNQIGEIKLQHKMGVMNISREEQQRRQVFDTAAELGIPRKIAGRFLNHILSESESIQYARRIDNMAIFNKAKELEMSGHDIIHMELGEPNLPIPESVGTALLEGFKAGHTKYGLAAGMPDFRQALAKSESARYGIRCGPENIAVTPGGRFAVYAAITRLLHIGDEIVIVEPAWPAYRIMALHAGIKPHLVQTTLEQRWEPDLTHLESLIHNTTKMIVLCYPSNPTGKILPRSIMDGIMDIAARKNLYVLSDEIYRDYYRTRRPRSVLEYEYDKSVAIQSFSKSHALTGFRVGYAIASPEIINTISATTAMCLSSMAEIMQYAALQSIKLDVTPNVRAIQDRLDIIIDMAKKAKMEFLEPDGSMYVFAKVPGMTGLELVYACLERGLALAPGVGFGYYPDFVRLSAGSDQVKSGMHILYDVLQDVS